MSDQAWHAGASTGTDVVTAPYPGLGLCPRPAGTAELTGDSRRDSWPLRDGDPIMVDDYRLVSRLGTGGMADVFKALAADGEPVVVKILRSFPGAVLTCLREFQLMRAVDPDVTAPVLGHGVSSAGAYLVTAYLPGYRCAAAFAGPPLAGDRLWLAGAALSRALATIHAGGVVHCDVKPANLLVRADDVRLIDFGIARYVDEPGDSDGTVHCSPGWAAPEQLCGAPATPSVDVFAWGCVLSLLATGVRPFAGRDHPERSGWLAPSHLRHSRAPGALAAMIRAALTRDPADRPSAGHLATACALQGAAR